MSEREIIYRSGDLFSADNAFELLDNDFIWI